jgi:polysaccharide pyruvyl transferase WcaK-like protein
MDYITTKMESKRTPSRSAKVAFLGAFNSSNFGNDSTLQAILYHLRRLQPHTEIACISTDPAAAAATHHIKSIPFTEALLTSWGPNNRLIRPVRRVGIGVLSEAYRWIKGVSSLRHTDVLIIPGGGLLNDAYGLLGWGPYNLLRWSLLAKLCRCKLLLVSVGAGPIYGMVGRWLVRSILFLADFRSYRDVSTRQYLEGIGFPAANDQVYPDLAFSLPERFVPCRHADENSRSVVGLGVMRYAGKYSDATPRDTTYVTYLECLISFVRWLLARGYDVKLLSGDVEDLRARQDFQALVVENLPACAREHIIDEPICSFQDLLLQITGTDIVVATRFHNVVFALLCKKPVISISFHPKCKSLMDAIGLSEYCLDIKELDANKLITKFC